MMMEREILEKVKRLVRKLGIVFLATTDRKGTPHIAASEGMTFTEDGKALFKAWFCLNESGSRTSRKTESFLLPF